MKKICFSDKYLLHDAVMEGTKTMTRRMVRLPKTYKDIEVRGFHKYTNTETGLWYAALHDEEEEDLGPLDSLYRSGEVIAIAHRYADITWDEFRGKGAIDKVCSIGDIPLSHPGWHNKLFVKPELMPHHIKITKVRLERLQNITDEECIAEGVKGWSKCGSATPSIADHYSVHGTKHSFPTLRAAFADLMDRLSGKGTWQENPWVWVYEFKRID